MKASSHTFSRCKQLRDKPFSQLIVFSPLKPRFFFRTQSGTILAFPSLCPHLHDRLIFIPKGTMPIIKLTVEYDGTAYAGWQRQPNKPTIQAALEEALFNITQRHITVVGAGRTDSGVHAVGQVASFFCDKSLAASQWASALNSLLPHNISVTTSESAPADFHARFQAKGKIYEYRIIQQSSRPALDYDRTWHFRYALDVAAMQQALRKFVGTHDFTSFRGQRSQTLNPICTISQFSLEVVLPLLTFRIEGDRFLKQMVRTIVGTLVEVGQHKRSPQSITNILEAKNRRAAGRTAPPQGLYLIKVLY